MDQVVGWGCSTIFPMEQNLADLEAVANIPLMIGEYSFMCNNDSGDPNSSIPASTRRLTPSCNAPTEYENFVAPLYEDTPALVGDDWFQYVDEPGNGRAGDGEDDDFGMIDVNGNPYPQDGGRPSAHAQRRR